MIDFGLGTLLLGLVLIAGVALNRFSKILKMPILLCFLGVGIVCGESGLNFFPLMTMSDVQIFGEIALCFIIFSGGLQTSFQSIKSVFVTGTLLATVGVVLTTLVLASMNYFFINHLPIYYPASFVISLMGCSVLSSTDAAAVFAILRGRNAAINPRLKSLLEYESGSNDPAAFLLTSIMIGVFLSQNDSFNILGISWDITKGIIWGLGVGASVGLLVGVIGQWFYNWIQHFLEYSGLRFVAAIAIVLFCYGLADVFFQANVLMACYVAGITMGNLRFSYKQIFIRLHDGVSWLMQIMLFTALGCFFDYHMLWDWRYLLRSFIVALSLMFVARPLAVLLCMTGSPFSFKERIFTSWVGIRGSAPIMLAALVVSTIHPEKSGYPKNGIFYIVFTVVLFSILLQGSTIMWVAKKLGLIQPYEKEKKSLLSYDERPDGSELHSFTIEKDNPLIGQNLFECGVTDGSAILLMIKRGEEILQQTQDIILQQGDLLSFVGTRESMNDLHNQFFPDNEYTSSPTFHQAWDYFIRENMKKFSRKSRKKQKA